MSENSLNELYVSWLTRFMEKNSQPYVRKIVPPLITELSTAQSLEELLYVFERYAPPPQSNEPSLGSSTFYKLIKPLNLLDQLSSWKKQLQEAVGNYSKALLALDEIEGEHKITPLINILKYIMKTPKLQLDCRIFSLIMCLSSPKLPLVFNFIANQEKAKLPENIPSGSFLAQVPIDSDHKHCLKLLKKVSTHYDDKNELWGLANSLLQTALLIYQDSHKKKANLSDNAGPSSEPTTSYEETDSTPHVADSSHFCVLF